MRYAWLLIVSLCVAIPALSADGWTGYSNARFSYSAEMPPGFKLVRESDNGGGAAFDSKDGARLLIFGAFAENGTFAADTRQRIAWDMQEGWAITYQKVTPGWASYSGSRSGDILYVRGIALCDGSAAYFYLTYPRAALKTYDPLVRRMVKSLRPAEGCQHAPAAAPMAAPN